MGEALPLLPSNVSDSYPSFSPPSYKVRIMSFALQYTVDNYTASLGDGSASKMLTVPSMSAGVWIPRAHVKGCVSVVWFMCNPSVREVETGGLWSKLAATPAKVVSS